MYLALWESRRWRFPATPALIFPVAVSLKRFLAPDFVFSFGISLRSRSPVLWRIDEPPWHAMGQAAPKGRGSRGNGRGKQGGGSPTSSTAPGAAPARQTTAPVGSTPPSAGTARQARRG